MAILLFLVAVFLALETRPKAPKDPTSRYISELRAKQKREALKQAERGLWG